MDVYTEIFAVIGKLKYDQGFEQRSVLDAKPLSRFEAPRAYPCRLCLSDRPFCLLYGPSDESIASPLQRNNSLEHSLMASSHSELATEPCAQVRLSTTTHPPASCSANISSFASYQGRQRNSVMPSTCSQDLGNTNTGGAYHDKNEACSPFGSGKDNILTKSQLVLTVEKRLATKSEAARYLADLIERCEPNRVSRYGRYGAKGSHKPPSWPHNVDHSQPRHLKLEVKFDYLTLICY